MQSILSASANESVENNPIIFGPIHSRRFGMSLGVDLSPTLKQCNFDCLYCELAPSATVAKQNKTIDPTTIINALQTHLNENIDVITLTANGEPTLYPHLDKLIDAINSIKKKTDTLILTNSATLTDEKIFQTLLKFDQVKLSLDAVSADVFKKIDRPHKAIDLTQLIEKVITFSHQYTGKLFIEILFVHELNDTKEEIKKLNTVLQKIQCTRIDLGTIDRPPAYPVVGISYKALHNISLQFDASLPIHIASRIHAEPNQSYYTKEAILNTLDKRPLTMEDIHLLFDDASLQNLETLIKEQKIIKKVVSHLEFLLPQENEMRKRKKS